MSGALVTQILLKIQATGTKASLPNVTADDPLAVDYTQLLSSGVGANQASNMFHDQRTLAPSATENLDVSGALTNAFGVSLVFTKIKAVFFKAAAANTNQVQVTRPAANGLPLFSAVSSGFFLDPGAMFLAVFPGVNGVAVTAGTADLITVTNSAAGTSVTYDVIIIGVD